MTAKTIRNIRKNNNLTQKRFAEIVGVTLRTVQKWEGSERNISKWHIIDLKEGIAKLKENK